MTGDTGEPIVQWIGQARRRWKDLVVVSAVGLVFLVMNFPKLLTRLVQSRVHQPDLQELLTSPIRATQASLSYLQQPSPAAMLGRLMSWNFPLLLLFLTLVALLSLRRRDARLIGFCLAGLLAGFFGGQLIAWIAVIAIHLFQWLSLLAHWLAAALHWLFALVLAGWFILLPLLILFLAWANAAALRVAWARWLAAWGRWLAAALRNGSRLLLWTLAALAGGALLWFLVTVVGPWLWIYLGPIFTFVKQLLGSVIHFIFLLVGWLVVALLIALAAIFLLNLVGRLVVDQLRAAWTVAGGRKEMAAAGFGVGTAFALILLMSAGTPQLTTSIDGGWRAGLATLDGALAGAPTAVLAWAAPTPTFWAVTPGAVEHLAKGYFDNPNPPLIDSLLLLAVLVLATLSAAAGLRQSRAAHPAGSFQDYFLPREYVALFGAFILGLVVAVIHTYTETTDS